ncbi:MAG: orotate phosphoribosyltransferase, partial [Phascolarctobacterium sp.]|nr:orotate phosphoribosyltransferase [Phascolarctobacterium sp.]
ERDNGKMTLKRGFHIEPGTRVLVVEDIVTTGGSVKEVMEVVQEKGGELVGVGLLVDRSGGKVDFGIRTEALLHLNVETFDPNSCPLCAEGKEFTKRGRTGK